VLGRVQKRLWWLFLRQVRGSFPVGSGSQSQSGRSRLRFRFICPLRLALLASAETRITHFRPGFISQLVASSASGSGVGAHSNNPCAPGITA